jgi:HPt (histidine-containing phosphotransfer) domain-containing protein
MVKVGCTKSAYSCILFSSHCSVEANHRGSNMNSVRAHALSDIPVDMNDLLGRCLGRLDIVERILQTFHRTMQTDLKQLECAVQAADADTIAHIAHRMRGASLAVAAHELEDYAQRIEASATTRQLDEVQRDLTKLKEQCARFDNLSSITIAG